MPFIFSLWLQKLNILKIWNSFNENHKEGVWTFMLHLCFSGDDLFLVISKIKLFITFWGLDSSYIKLINEYKNIKYCCFFVVTSWLCLRCGILLFFFVSDLVKYISVFACSLWNSDGSYWKKATWEEGIDYAFVRTGCLGNSSQSWVTDIVTMCRPLS